jgi:crotonobetaine/carnitine-CoA ligase
MWLLEELFATAAAHPSRVFLRMPRRVMTYGDTATQIRRVAAGLRDLGVVAGCKVALFMRNRPEHVVATFAISQIGGVAVPLNTDLVGQFLLHPMTVADCRYVVVEAELVSRLRQVLDGLPDLHTMVVVGEDPAADRPPSDRRVVSYSEVESAEPLAGVASVSELDAAVILFTSGTTGPSKGCVLSHRYLARQAHNHAKYLALRPDDVLYSPFPLFHIDAAVLTVGTAAAIGATAAIGTRFSVSGFWSEVRDFDATVLNFMGAMLALVWRLPVSEEDRTHRLRLGWGVPMPAWSDAWRERFGFELYEVYGLTDGGVVTYDPYPSGRRPGACGRVIAEFEVGIADPDGDLLRTGQPGEIVIRPREAGTVMTEYVGMPAETVEAFRGLWLHTGDLGRLDEDGFLYFGGRLKDSIRRRGENISLAEVEDVMAAHPDVVEVAAVGVPSDLAEEDLKLCIVLRDHADTSPADLAAYFAERAPRFMVPKYIELLPDLPKTPTQKVEKFKLRDAGVTARTWSFDSAVSGSRRT